MGKVLVRNPAPKQPIPRPSLLQKRRPDGLCVILSNESKPFEINTMGTSISNLIGLNGKSPPTVFWRKTANQYMTYIGFHLAGTYGGY